MNPAEAIQAGRAMDYMLQGNADTAFNVIDRMLERRSREAEAQIRTADAMRYAALREIRTTKLIRHAALRQLQAGDTADEFDRRVEQMFTGQEA